MTMKYYELLVINLSHAKQLDLIMQAVENHQRFLKYYLCRILI